MGGGKGDSGDRVKRKGSIELMKKTRESLMQSDVIESPLLHLK